MVTLADPFRTKPLRHGAATAALLLLALPAWPQQSGGAPPTRISTSPARAAPVAVKPAGELNMTAYTGFGRFDPRLDSRSTPLEIDLSVALAACPDNNLEISAMHIGGWRYNVAGVCEDTANQGSIALQGIGKTSVVATTRPPGDADQPMVLRCDPATWRCGPTKP